MIYISVLIIVIISFSPAKAQTVVKEVPLHNRLHYKVSNRNATYFIDKYSGGISSIIDKDGNDWINWNRLQIAKYPESAAGDYRGIPNLVFGDNDSGVGHPGFDKAQSFVEKDNCIRVKSISEKWEWQYKFHSRYVEIEIIRTPKMERNYWFLYEGVPGGKFNPDDNYWGTNTGIKSLNPDYLKGEEVYGFWKWVFFGDINCNQTFFIVQKHDDDLKDTFGYLGNSQKGLAAEDGMVVFGFGRDKNATPLLNENNTFYIGFYDKKLLKKYFLNSKNIFKKCFNILAKHRILLARPTKFRGTDFANQSQFCT